jgi:GTPase SAR1 family protein
MIVGNKSDLESNRAVSQEEAMDYAKQNGLMFMETSALESVNVEKAFDSLINNIFDKLSGKLATMDDKRAEIIRGQAIQLSPPTMDNNQKSSSSCAC